MRVHEVAGDGLHHVALLPEGVAQQLVKQSKLKVQAAIQGDSVRISGAKRDDLQATMAMLRKELPDVPLSFNNFRD